jgi:23S rRNA (uracil1939-C5)-methyltransferase
MSIFPSMTHPTVTIEKLVFGGYGLARTPSGVIFVTDVAPGETVLVEPRGKKGGQPLYKPVEIVNPSPSRRAPPCPYANTCGGCNWLYIDHAAQISIKQEIFIDCMRRVGRIKDLPVITTIADGEFAYRQRAQIKIDERGKTGFYGRETNTVVPIDRCPLLVPSINALLTDFSKSTVAPPPGEKNLMILAGDGGALASFPVLQNRTLSKVRIAVENKIFDVSGGGFFQSNRPLLARFGSWALPFVSGDFCVDLYGGCGFFSVLLAEKFKRGLLIESVGAQVAAAGNNFQLNGIDHFDAREGAAEGLDRMIAGRTIDSLIVDPPRVGLSAGARAAIAKVKPRTILYVSCDPATQARDVGFLTDKTGYRIDQAVLFDLYPNTHHIESAIILSHR